MATPPRPVVAWGESIAHAHGSATHASGWAAAPHGGTADSSAGAIPSHGAAVDPSGAVTDSCESRATRGVGVYKNSQFYLTRGSFKGKQGWILRMGAAATKSPSCSCLQLPRSEW